jgi:hypothetical protein
MTNLQHQEALQILKNNLYGNRAIYHERISILIEFLAFDILETSVKFKAKIIKPLDDEHANKRNIYKYFTDKPFIQFSASYKWSEDENSNTDILKGSTLWRPYCPFMLWLDHDLVQFVSEQNDEVTKKLDLMNGIAEDWKNLE